MSLGQILLNLEGILKCSGIEDKDTAKIYRDKYQVECHLQNMVKSAKTILSVTGELKRVCLNTLEYCVIIHLLMNISDLYVYNTCVCVYVRFKNQFT